MESIVFSILTAYIQHAFSTDTSCKNAVWIVNGLSTELRRRFNISAVWGKFITISFYGLSRIDHGWIMEWDKLWLSMNPDLAQRPLQFGILAIEWNSEQQLTDYSLHILKTYTIVSTREKVLSSWRYLWSSLDTFSNVRIDYYYYETHFHNRSTQ